MLVRDDDLLITQPAHAWISGQMARAWSGAFAPHEAVCLAAQQHDAGWIYEDLHPLLDPASGRPRHFTRMPLAVHLDLWSHASEKVLAQSSYAALLVSLHGTSLYSRREPTAEITSFLEGERIRQAHLSEGLDPGELDRNRRLLLAWDHLSLAACLDWNETTVPGVPGFGDLTVGNGRVDPWPFRGDELTLATEAISLPGTFDSEDALRQAYVAAPRRPFEITLRPA